MARLLLIFTTLILFPFSISSQSTRNIAVGSPITASENSTSWLSPSGEFAFGFQQLKNKTFFVLSIWFAKIPDHTIAWFERTSYPVPLGSILTVDATFGLVLRDPHGNSLYNTSGLAHEVAYALMSDTGNFILSQSNSNPLWESFNSPSDTILPSQKIEVNGSTLISKKSETDFSYGRFYAGMNSGGNFVLDTKSVFTNTDSEDEYYNSASNSDNGRLVFDESTASISVGKSTLLRSNLTHTEYYFRATLDFDGVFLLYRFPKKFDKNSRWISEGSLPERNICLEIDGDKGTGACGLNSVCSLVNQRPVCHCPEGFSFLDRNNTYGDCKSNFIENCIDKEGQYTYELKEIKDVDWPFNDYQQMNPCTKIECKTDCMDDPFCGAAIHRNESCWKKRLPLSNGRIDPTLGATAFLKVRTFS